MVDIFVHVTFHLGNLSPRLKNSGFNKSEYGCFYGLAHIAKLLSIRVVLIYNISFTLGYNVPISLSYHL